MVCTNLDLNLIITATLCQSIASPHFLLKKFQTNGLAYVNYKIYLHGQPLQEGMWHFALYYIQGQ